MIKQTIDLNHLISNKIINLHHYITIPLTCKVKQTTEVQSKATEVLSSIAATVWVFPLSHNNQKNAVQGFTKQKVSDANAAITGQSTSHTCDILDQDTLLPSVTRCYRNMINSV